MPALEEGPGQGLFPSGTGVYIQLCIRAVQYDKVATMPVVVVMVVAIEQLSVWLRRRPR